MSPDDAQLRDPMLGTMLGTNYRVRERIGQGGMGVVYLVEHETLGKAFAAKVLSAEHAINADARDRFLSEARTICKLEHRNIISVSDFGVAGDLRPYLIMELLKGQSLEERLRQGTVPLEEAVAIVFQVGDALEAAHSAGFVHRDIKPENIFLVQRASRRIDVKVLDFGIAKLPQNTKLTREGFAIGSPAYMAPEACKGHEVDVRADIYALAVVLFQLLCGALPFHDANPLAILHMQVHAPLPSPQALNPDISDELAAVLRKALAKDRGKRYPSIVDFLEDFGRALPSAALRLLRQPTQLSEAVTLPPDENLIAPPAPPLIAPSVGGPRTRTRAAATELTGSAMPSLRLLALIGSLVFGVVFVFAWRHHQTRQPPRLAAPAHAQALPVSEPPTDRPAAPPPAPATPRGPAFMKLEITSEPTGATIMNGPTVWGPAPLSREIPADAWPLELAATLPGYETQHLRATSPSEGPLRLELKRLPRPSAKPESAPPLKRPGPLPQTQIIPPEPALDIKLKR